MKGIRIIILVSISINGLFIHAKAQLSQLMGIDTTQSLGNFDYIFKSAVLPGGNIWIAGRCERTLSISGGQVSNYGALLQLSPSGNIITSKKSGFRSIHTLATTADGNMVIGGEGRGFFCTSGLCKSDMLVAKVSSNYSVLWGRSFGNPNYNGTDGVKQVFESSDSNIVVVGNMYESSMNSHPFIAKLNGATGDTIWTRALGYPSNQFGNCASEGPNGELFLGVSGDLRIFKLDAAGSVIWSKGFANYGQVIRTFGQSDGSVIAAGHYLASSGSYNSCLLKVSGAGILEWFRDYDTPLPDHYEFIHDVISDNGSFYFSGYHYSNPNYTGMYPLLFKTNAVGDIIWSLEHSLTNGAIKSIMANNGNVLCGIDYIPPVTNNRPDILLTEVSMTGTTTSCFVPHPLNAGTPVINPIPNGTWYYTDYETQVTPIAFSNQNYWRVPACISTGISESVATMPFTIFIEDGNLSIEPETDAEYLFEIYDLSGKTIFKNNLVNGRQVVNLSGYSNSLVLIKILQKDFQNSFSQKFLITN